MACASNVDLRRGFADTTVVINVQFVRRPRRDDDANTEVWRSWKVAADVTTNKITHGNTYVTYTAALSLSHPSSSRYRSGCESPASRIGWHSMPGPCLPPSLVVCWVTIRPGAPPFLQRRCNGDTWQSPGVRYGVATESGQCIAEPPLRTGPLSSHVASDDVCSLSVNILWTSECRSLWYLPSLTSCWCE